MGDPAVDVGREPRSLSGRYAGLNLRPGLHLRFDAPRLFHITGPGEEHDTARLLSALYQNQRKQKAFLILLLVSLVHEVTVTVSWMIIWGISDGYTF